MSKSSRRREVSSRDSMAFNATGNQDECNDAVRELVSAVASSSNEDIDAHLNGRMNLRDRPSAASFPSNTSGKNDESAADAKNATNQIDYKTLNGKDDEKQGLQGSLSVAKESTKPALNGLVMAEGVDSSVGAHNRDMFQPPLTPAMKDDEFRNFLGMDAPAIPTNQYRNDDSNLRGNAYSLGACPIPYHPLEGESLLRRALTGMVSGTRYQYGGVQPTRETMNFPQQNGNDEENSDVDVEMVDDGEAEPNNLNNSAGAGTSRAARNSTVQKRKLAAQSSKNDAKKGVASAVLTLEKAETSFAEMSKQQIRAFIQKESKKPKPDFPKLSEAMDITYSSTRKSMYDQGQVDVRDIKQKYPALLHYRMVKEELGRILKDPTKMERLEKELDKEVLSSALEGKKKTLCPGKKRHPIWKKSIQLWEENKGSNNSAHQRRVLGMLAVCFEFAENAVVAKLCRVLKQNEKLSDSEVSTMDIPVIVVRESQIFNVFEEADIWIYVDGQKYIKVPNMYEAVLTVFAVYYIFNIAYDKSLKSLFEFFDYLCDNPQSTYPKTH